MSSRERFDDETALKGAWSSSDCEAWLREQDEKDEALCDKVGRRPARSPDPATEAAVKALECGWRR